MSRTFFRRMWTVFLLIGMAPIQAAAEPAREMLARGRQALAETRFDDAVAAFEAAAAQFEEAGDVGGRAEARLEMGLVLIEAGAMRRGLATIEASIASLPRGVPPTLHGKSLVRLAQGRRSTGDLIGAKAALAEAAVVYEAAADAAGQARVWAVRSSIAGQAGSWQAAASSAAKAVRLATDPEMRLGAIAWRSYAVHQLGDLEEAEKGYREVLALSRAQGDFRQVNFAYCNLADVKWQMGQAKPALTDLWQALEGIERARSSIAGTPGERTAYLARQVAVYDRLIRFLVDTSDSRSAFNVAERFRARSFLEMLQAPDDAASNPDWIVRERQIVSGLGEARLALQQAGSEPARVRQRQAVEELEIELDRVRAALRSPDTEIAGFALGDVSALQAELEPNEVVVAYWVSAERTLVWVLGQDDRMLFQVPLSHQKLSAAVHAYLEPLRFPRRAEDLAIRGEEAAHVAMGKELYRWLIDPMPDWARSADRLVIIPDAELHYLPFEALIRTCLPTSAEGDQPIHRIYQDCRYLGLEKALVYSPSAGTFLAIRRRARQRRPDAATGSLLAMAPTFEQPEQVAVRVLPAEVRGSRLRGLAPLRHTADEVRRIASLIPRSHPWVGSEASEARFKSEAGRFRILHLATHGLVDDDLPMSSGVLLDGGSGEDGLLQANEILRLRLNADLVILSSCRSGRGVLQRGQGIIGLSRAFLFAGASAVAVSLWDVDDRSTPLLMESFYRHRAQGLGHAEALRAARLDLFDSETEAQLVRKRRRVAYAHPRFWAGFVLIGAP